jgi:nicotinamidase-related amidase
VNLGDLVAPEHTVLVTQECQNGVIGAQAIFPELAKAAADAIPNMARITAAARTRGVHVIHCLALRREDGLGANDNARLFGAARKASVKLLPGSEAAGVISEIGVAGTDIVLGRLHGLGPMAGTELDSVLRNLKATTIVGIGVSVNVGMTNFVMDAVNLGYQFVLPRDATAGIPREYADAVIDNTLSLLATITTAGELLDAWRA